MPPASTVAQFLSYFCFIYFEVDYFPLNLLLITAINMSIIIDNNDSYAIFLIVLLFLQYLKCHREQ